MTMKLSAFNVELTVTVENELRGVVAGLMLTLRLAPSSEVIVGEPTESMKLFTTDSSAPWFTDA
jgi:hypothetical protein